MIMSKPYSKMEELKQRIRDIGRGYEKEAQ
jgi:hypothetical protein